jgi:hypothetical protein
MPKVFFFTFSPSTVWNFEEKFCMLAGLSHQIMAIYQHLIILKCGNNTDISEDHFQHSRQLINSNMGQIPHKPEGEAVGLREKTFSVSNNYDSAASCSLCQLKGFCSSLE